MGRHSRAAGMFICMSDPTPFPEDILTEVVSALFNIVAKLESESGGS